MAEEFEECATALRRASSLVPLQDEDIRVKFCSCMDKIYIVLVNWFSIANPLLLPSSSYVGKEKGFCIRDGRLYALPCRVQ